MDSCILTKLTQSPKLCKLTKHKNHAASWDNAIHIFTFTRGTLWYTRKDIWSTTHNHRRRLLEMAGGRDVPSPSLPFSPFPSLPSLSFPDFSPLPPVFSYPYSLSQVRSSGGELWAPQACRLGRSPATKRFWWIFRMKSVHFLSLEY